MIGITILHVLLIRLIMRLSTRVAGSEHTLLGIAIPKYEIAQFLATYEGTTMLAALVFAYASNSSVATRWLVEPSLHVAVLRTLSTPALCHICAQMSLALCLYSVLVTV
jgi:hypothetical protein